MNSNHDLISPTAKLTAHLRAETDIPFSKEIDELCGAKEITEKVFGDTGNLIWMAGMLELRYKSLSACLVKEMDKGKISQVIELASGLLPRGVIMSQDSSTTYVETDLRDMAVEKKKIVAELNQSFLERENYSIIPLNALDSEDLLDIGRKLEGKVAVINEGLLPYLSVEEKITLAKNIYQLLDLHGGVWITPDISNSGRMKKIIEIFPDAQITNQKLNELVGRDMRSNSIEGGRDGAVEFYKNIGFTITEYKAGELTDHLVSLDKISDEVVQNSLHEALYLSSVWVLEIVK